MKFLPYILLIFAVSLNLYWLFPETRALYDVNDNVFAYSLALRTNEVWDTYCPAWMGGAQLNVEESGVALGSETPIEPPQANAEVVGWEKSGTIPATQRTLWHCLSNLTDHWVDYWAQGYPLPHFYQHLPSIIFVGIYKLVNLPLLLVPSAYLPIGLYSVFRWIQFLYLSIFPLTLYWSARKFGFDRLTSSFVGLIATLISTQFLYGTDLNAVTWRGSGMTTQLLGMVTLPLAVGSIYDSLVNNRKFARSAILLAFTFHMHLLFGFIAGLSTVLLWTLITSLDFVERLKILSTKFEAPNKFKALNSSISKFRILLLEFIWSLGFRISYLAKVLIPTALLLAYWLIPLLQHNSLHNTSVWDEQIKFNSYGAKEVILKLASGQLLDANRPPVLTFLLAIGLLVSLSKFFSGKASKPSQLFLPGLFFFWMALYFGPATWGKLFFLIPASEGLHVHRLLNGIHFASFFLIAIAIQSIIDYIVVVISKTTGRLEINLPSKAFLLTPILIPLLLLLPVFRERNAFMKHNAYLIEENHKIYLQEKSDLDKAMAIIAENPLRVNAGRPGNWGKEFQTGGSANFLQLSQSGISTIGWLPQSWSPFSDIEQFWDENRLDHFQLMNVGWIYSPLSQPLPDFATEKFQGNRSHLAQVPTSGNFQFITVPFAAFGHKNHVLNFQRLWLESDWPQSWSFPQLILTDDPIAANEVGVTGAAESLNSQTTKLKRPPGSPVDGANLYLTDMGTGVVSGQTINLINSKLFEATPSALPTSAKIISETKFNPHQYSVEVETGEMLALMAKFTYHPYWQVTVDGNPHPTFMVTPAFLATAIPPGHHTVSFTYTVPAFKKFLLFVSLFTFIFLILPKTRYTFPIWPKLKS